MNKTDILGAIKYEYIRGSSALETSRSINAVCENKYNISMKIVRLWFNKFDTGDFDMSKAPLDTPTMSNINFDELKNRFKSNKYRASYTYTQEYRRPAPDDVHVNLKKTANDSGKRPCSAPAEDQMNAKKKPKNVTDKQQVATADKNKNESSAFYLSNQRSRTEGVPLATLGVGDSNSPGAKIEMRAVLVPPSIVAMRKLALGQINKQFGRSEVKPVFVKKPTLLTNNIDGKEVNKRNNN